MGAQASLHADTIYNNFDADKNKKLDLAEIKKLLECTCVEAEQKILPKEYDLLFYLIDKDGNDSISKKEFARLHEGMQKTNYREDIYQLIAFMADANGDGTISKKEMKIIYSFYGKKMEAKDEAMYAKDISKELCVQIIKTKLM